MVKICNKMPYHLVIRYFFCVKLTKCLLDLPTLVPLSYIDMKRDLTNLDKTLEKVISSLPLSAINKPTQKHLGAWPSSRFCLSVFGRFKFYLGMRCFTGECLPISTNFSKKKKEKKKKKPTSKNDIVIIEKKVELMKIECTQSLMPILLF